MATGKHVNYLETALLAILAASVLFFAMYNLEGYPSMSSWDEGMLLQYPKNLALYGKYGYRTSEGISIGFTSVGPTVMLPIALVFKVLGVGLWQARAVMGVFLMLAVVAVYFLGRCMYGPKVAVAAAFLFLCPTSHWMNTIWLGRQLYGEVPATFFLLCGTYLWLKSLEGDRRLFIMGAGLMFALAVITKYQYIWIAPSLIVVWFLDRVLHKRRLKISHFSVLLLGFAICFVIGAGYVIAQAGLNGLIRHVSGMGVLSSRVAWTFSPRLWYDNARFLYQFNFVLWGVPSLIYVFLLHTRKREEQIGQLLLPTFAVLWAIWYIFASIGWERYAYPAFAMITISAAKFFTDLTEGFDISLSKLRLALSRQGGVSVFKNVAVTALVVLSVLIPLLSTAKRAISSHDQTAQQFAEYVDSHIPTDALIESWQWEIDFLTDRDYHHPSRKDKVALHKHIYFGDPYPTYSIQDEFDYVIDGPFSKLVGIYSSDLQKGSWELVTSIGEYDLYKRAD